ncbi:MAG: RNA-binding transcriptional accessory protein [Bacteroidetes bacterium 4572_112]|nr:MAG: RNA-binding transcriptional accessory protein [Bacteroidetes bacterium 4572_112]
MISHISKKLNLDRKAVQGTIELLEKGAGIPFIARYRKEATGGLDEVAIENIRDAHLQYIELEKRKKYVIESIAKQDLLSDILQQKIEQSLTLSEIEDIYLPFKPKRKTKASVAKERGLEPLAKIIMSQNNPDFYFQAEHYTKHPDIADAEMAVSGALDIIAEWINERPAVRKSSRRLWQRQAVIQSKKKTKAEDEQQKFKPYYDWEERMSKAPSHRVLALLRGEKEGVLRLKIGPDEDVAINSIKDYVIKTDSTSRHEISIAVKDSYRRLLSSSLETEFRAELKENADAKAINVFAENLRQLLMTSPLGQKVCLAIDPGFRSGCKLVVLDAQGKLLHNETIYPHPPQREATMAKKKLSSLVNMYKVEAIAIGNGTAGRETEKLVQNTHFDRKIQAVMVNENGASIYSASALAREEFPDYDITVRGSVSIGRRLMDPLAELVKIDPKSIGVGQYQHDVDQKKLQAKLADVVSSVVNSVGVELNTASKEILQYVVGIGPSTAKKIVDFRNENGAFESRKQLMKISGFGAKAFEQAAGFIRIRDARNPLDNTAVHPESYSVVDKMAKKLKKNIAELIEDKESMKLLQAEDFVTDKFGLFTVKDIIAELQKPNRDPRSKIEFFEFEKSVNSPQDLEEGMILPGIITNITAFGAFVDVGVHQDGLVHISELANEFVSDPHQYVKLNQKVQIKVLKIDLQRKRLQFSMKDLN